MAGLAPGPRGRPIVGSYFDIQRDPLGFFVRASRDYGHVFAFSAALQRPWYHISHPEYLEHVLQRGFSNYPKGRFGELISLVSGRGLLALDGEAWSRQRRLMQPAFHRDRLAALTTVIQNDTSRMIDEWDRLPGRPSVVELHAEFSRLTLGITARILFGIDIGDSADRIYGEYLRTLEYLNYRLVHPFALPWPVPTPANLRYRSALGRLNEMLDEQVEAARRSGAARGGLLAMLLETRDEHDQPMSHAQLRAEMRTAIAAGHETTSTALFWTCYLLAGHPDSERRVHDEVDALSGPPAFEDLGRLPFTRMVIDEAMRLYPSVFWQGRVAVEDDEIGGYRIPAGSSVVLGFYVAQRHPDFWTDPDRFDPDRFARGVGTRPRGAFLPFGLGPRQCIGIHLANIETAMVVASVARRFRLRPVEEGEIRPEVMAALRPKRGVMFRLERR